MLFLELIIRQKHPVVGNIIVYEFVYGEFWKIV